MVIHALSEAVAVSSQIWPADMAGYGRDGVTIILNHRPDGEEASQPEGAAIEAAARSAGLDYVAAPIRGLPDAAAVAATAAVLAGLGPDDRVLMFCRSGMRSTAAWAMAERARGADADELRARAADAGYDIGGVPL